MAKTKVAITKEIDCFKVNGKYYAFKGKVAEFISPEYGRITVIEAFELPELLAELVKNKSDLIEEVENVTEDTEPKNPDK